jgi:hypothetical protein
VTLTSAGTATVGGLILVSASLGGCLHLMPSSVTSLIFGCMTPTASLVLTNSNAQNAKQSTT